MTIILFNWSLEYLGIWCDIYLVEFPIGCIEYILVLLDSFPAMSTFNFTVCYFQLVTMVMFKLLVKFRFSFDNSFYALATVTTQITETLKEIVNVKISKTSFFCDVSTYNFLSFDCIY